MARIKARPPRIVRRIQERRRRRLEAAADRRLCDAFTIANRPTSITVDGPFDAELDLILDGSTR